jgi:cob(I)alamin adenosyltransferase
MKIYTKTGDAGETSLFGGARVAKNDARIEAYGTVDELNSFIGVARAAWPSSPIDAELNRIQADLFDVGAHLASPGSDRFSGADPARVEALERAIDAMTNELPALTTFILPGGSPAGAQLHVARTVCRRAERLIVALKDETTVRYLNRLSDYLFTAARFTNLRLSTPDVPWNR